MAEARNAKAVELLPGNEVVKVVEQDARAGKIEDSSLRDFIADRRSGSVDCSKKIVPVARRVLVHGAHVHLWDPSARWLGKVTS